MQAIIALLATAPRTTCEELLNTTTDGDLRGLIQARIKFLDNIQKEAQATIYRETPPAMIYAGDIQDWWYEKFNTLNILDIDFRAIADNKKQEWYAYQNEQIETQL